MKAKDVKKLEVEKMNKKSGETFTCNVGKQYLEFLLTLRWLVNLTKKVKLKFYLQIKILNQVMNI